MQQINATFSGSLNAIFDKLQHFTQHKMKFRQPEKLKTAMPYKKRYRSLRALPKAMRTQSPHYEERTERLPP